MRPGEAHPANALRMMKDKLLAAETLPFDEHVPVGTLRHLEVAAPSAMRESLAALRASREAAR